MHTPRHVRIDEPEPERLHRLERSTPIGWLQAPVVNGPDEQWQNATADSYPLRNELDATSCASFYPLARGRVVQNSRMT